MEKINQIRYFNSRRFLHSGFSRIVQNEYLMDALRNTLSIVLPMTCFFYYGNTRGALAFGLGTLLICQTDLPGNRSEKFRTALVSVALFFLTSLVMRLSVSSFFLISCCIVSLTFAFAMMSILGARMALVGLMSNVLAIFILGINPAEIVQFNLYLISGTVFYYLISLLQVWISPYRSIYFALHQCLITTAKVLRLRAEQYTKSNNNTVFDHHNILLHLELHTQHEELRDLLLTDQILMNTEHRAGRKLLVLSQDAVDLYEQIIALPIVPQKPNQKGIIQESGNSIGSILNLFAQMLEICRLSFLKNDSFEKVKPLLKLSHRYAVEIAGLADKSHDEHLKTLNANIQQILHLIDRLSAPSEAPVRKDTTLEKLYCQFLSTEPLSLKTILEQFSIHRPIFRFSLRLAIICSAAMLIGLWFSERHYTYWLLLTIVVVNRPSFGLTWQRNKDRLIGTFVGLVIGFALLSVFKRPDTRILLGSLSLIGFFTFARIRYGLSVCFITIMVVLCLTVFYGNSTLILLDRFMFTLAGCMISIAAAFIFPIWQSPKIKELIHDALVANEVYFAHVGQLQRHNPFLFHRMRISRKAAYLKFANFSQALQSLKKEPGTKRIDKQKLAAIEQLIYLIMTRIGAHSHPSEHLVETLPISFSNLGHQFKRCADLSLKFDLSKSQSTFVYQINLARSNDLVFLVDELVSLLNF